MSGRLLRVTGTVLVIAAAFVTPVLATSAPASADTVVNGCTIVANPTSTNFTNCPGADLAGTNLSGVNLSYANLAGANFANCAGFFCLPANLSDVNLSHANLAATSFAACFSNPDTTPGGFCLVANVGNANLTQANLSESILVACFFPEVPPFSNCGSADFTGATLTGANMTGTALVPSDQSATTSSAGAVVTWSSPSEIPGATPGTCSSTSGSTFPLGTTVVTCQVLDTFGDVATGTFNVTVDIATTTSVSSSTNPSVFGQSVNYAARVSPTPTGGTVAFTDNGHPLAGCSAVPLSGASAICSGTPDATGTHNIVATYSGSGAFAGSTSPSYPFPASFTQVVTKAPCEALAGCNLAGLELFDVSLAGADLQNDNLTGADLFGAILFGADLQGDNLVGANLFGADLTGANLQGDNLKGASLLNAVLAGANLKGANVGNVTWADTICSDGTNSDNDGGTCVGHL